MLCCLGDSAIIVCSVCEKSADKTQNQLSIEEAKMWYVKRGDPIYCRKCLIEEKLRLKQELETLKAINNMKNKKKESKLQPSLRPIKDGKAWKKSQSFLSAHKPSQKAMELTKRAEKRSQSKQEIKEKRKETFQYNLRKEMEVRRKLARFEKGEQEQSQKVQRKIRRASQDAGKTPSGPSEATIRSRRRRSSIVDFFKNLRKGRRSSSISMPRDSPGLGNIFADGRSGSLDEKEEEQDLVTPVSTANNSPRGSFNSDGRNSFNDGRNSFNDGRNSFNDGRNSFNKRVADGTSDSDSLTDTPSGLNNISEDPTIEDMLTTQQSNRL
ncbi:hypothetical protein HOP50_16g78460 [Chloropicon primus]|uniref:Uncharacterized protein n=1 Tax=Chloropicon primus TaxID=1764295 RepID=A0A5B8MWU4_9CHLO|nr:hypothetical protein A3770_16p78160 [Chloropicon primus]UPR04504.1 hypothetical protein HOP50_16g78460 [Chloropicon primus]|eukprot:QDZ25298.1 hypothetical protein A3770_16p78160 [Chloropicon primus]